MTNHPATSEVRCSDCDKPPRTPNAKRCAGCHAAAKKARARAAYDENPEKGRATSRAWRAANPEKAKSSYTEWRAKNVAQENARFRAWYQQNVDRQRRRSIEWCRKNPGYSKRRYANNPEAKKARELKRRSMGSVDVLLRAAVNDAAGGICSYCLRRAALTMDHVLPISRGGSHGPENLVMACAACNSAKGTRTPLEFAFDIWRRPA